MQDLALLVPDFAKVLSPKSALPESKCTMLTFALEREKCW